jgi:hypothetical protein
MILSTHGIVGSQIQSFVGLLDTYPNAAAAYSVRKLRTLYTGNAIRVRRSSDNTEQDIGFSSGNLDTTALTTFCSGTNGFVTTWYDQSGNAINAVQTTASRQPQIVSSGSILTLTGTGSANPCMLFDGINHFFDLPTTLPISTGDSFSIYQLEKKTNMSSVGIWITGGATSSASPFGPVHYIGNVLYMNVRFNATISDYANGSVIANNYNLISGYMKNSTTTSDAYINNTLYSLSLGLTNEPRATNFNRIGNRVSEFSGTRTQEMIIYLSNQSANNTAINTNINTYYGIY